MTNDEKIASAKAAVKSLRKAQKALNKAKILLLETNEVVRLDPSGEPEKIQDIVADVNSVLYHVGCEQHRWDTYLENRE